jgi:Ser/Thr protein kinase RdoA (MazF antagonist)
MSSFPWDEAAREVLGRYSVLGTGFGLKALANAGGFSGARIWRVEGTAGEFCLRAWPASGPSAERLDALHRWMIIARESGLAFIPTVLTNYSGSRTVEMADRLWEVTTWMPGRADFRERPSRARLEAACAALAQLHLAWAGASVGAGPCPGVMRRLDCVRSWSASVQSGWDPTRAADSGDPIQPWAERACQLVLGRIDEVPRKLAPWIGRPVPLQLCLCDVWHAHILFTGAEVTGLIDFGSVKSDHVAVDLARLLGSLVDDDPEQRLAGLDVYARLRPLSPTEIELFTILDETGTLLGIANWLMWLYRDRRSFANRNEAARRLGELVTRVERWK